MEEALLALENKRQNQHEIFNNNANGNKDDISKACKSFAKVLHDYCRTLSKNMSDVVVTHGNNNTSSKLTVESSTQQQTKQSKGHYSSTTSWLYNLCQTIPSPLDTKALSSAILSACQKDDEMQIQASLFDTLGESERAMEVLFEIVPRAMEIKNNVNEKELNLIHCEINGDASATSGSAMSSMINSTSIDPEQERLKILRQQAIEAAQYAALTKAEAEAITGSGYNKSNSHTHSISRTSDKEIIKQAKQAAKAAAKAMTAAKQAGAIVDEDEILSRGYNMSTLAAEELYGNMDQIGLHKMDDQEFRKFQSNLLPEGSRQYYEQKGLPSGTEREICDGYEKVTIPARVLKPEQKRSRILIKDVMNSTEQHAFAGTKSLNAMQSTVFEAAFNSNENLLICAPTGAGKTNVAMLTVVAHLRDKGIIKNENDPYAAYQHIGTTEGENKNSNGNGRGVTSQVGRKIVYIAPMKALAQEVVEKFSSKLKALNIVVRELTGDMQLTRAEAERADILVTTPEKWDVVTRKSSDDSSLGNTCGLLIIDEVHLLADERGAVIESVVARLHRLVESRQRQVRLVGLSATLPNYKDVASFLRVHPTRGLFHFGPEHRPVPLQQQFIGVNDIKPKYKYDAKMNEVCYDVVCDSLQRGYQVMVFVHSRKGTGETARALAEIASKRNELDRYFITMGSEENGEAHTKYADRVEKSKNKEVREHFGNGCGIHHAGMLRNDRKLTEQMFADGAIKVLCCTATLAWGINLPAHTVVVKGTDVYNPEKGGNIDLSILDVMQIFGRAGRPQFDTSGEATLITSQDGLARYLNKLVREVPIESNFIKQLADHLNAEVVSGTVTNIVEATEWLQYTYLFCRMLKNPLAYGINANQRESDPTLNKRSVELITEAAITLDSHKMIRCSTASGNLGITELGRVASHYYIRAESMAIFNEMIDRSATLSDADLLNIICSATEFENVKVRPEELDEIDRLKKTQSALEVITPVEDFAGKCCVLMQAYISKAKVSSFTLISDTNYIASNAGRVARALFEICLKKGEAGAALKLLRIAKSVDKRIWWFQTPLRQFEGIPSNVFRALEARDEKVSMSTEYDPYSKVLYLLEMQPGEIGEVCRWKKGGKDIKKFVGYLPFLDVDCSVQPLSRSILRFNVTLRPDFNWNGRWHGGVEGFWLWVEDSENSRIYHQEYVLLQKRTFPDPVNLELTIPAFEPLPSQYYIRIVSDTWVGSETIYPVSFQHLLLPEQKMPHTDLMDITPLPIKALDNPKFEQLYSKYATFNPIQTQLFHVLYHTNYPVLLGAPTGSGKTTVAEIALLRMKRLEPKAKCVYIAPLKSLARERLKEWRRKLGTPPLNWKVLELSGDTHHDEKTLKNADILVCTPEKWDLISRGWRGSDEFGAKTFVKDVRLLVIDEIHLLGEERGAVLEAIVSRTRYISQLIQAEKNDDKNIATNTEVTRIIGLSTAIANPHDLADWMGINVNQSGGGCIGLYNFRPSVRPIPMTVHLSGYAGRHYCPRMATMNKPCYAAIQDHSPNKPVIIFVASRRQTRLTALDLITYAAGDANPTTFLGCDEEYIHSIASTLNDASLRHTITFGIGLHHAGLTTKDRDVVEELFLNGDIQVLVATATLAWGVNLPAHLVIVKGTEYFDGKESRYVDYPVTDVLQMMGRAGRPQFDNEGVACVMVEESKRNFYSKFLYNPFPVESCLFPRLADTINAEIAIGTITTIEDCLGYLDWTFYGRRVRNNPSYYGVESDGEEVIIDFLHKTIIGCLDGLKNNHCILINEEDGSNAISPTALGSTASKFYLNHKTPKQMLVGAKETRLLIKDCWKASKISHNENDTSFLLPSNEEEESISHLLYQLSQIHEFDELPVRHNEEQLNMNLGEQLRWGLIPLVEKNKKVRVEADPADPHTKCFLLIQAYIMRSELPISDYVNDTKSVIEQIPRLLAAMERLSLEEKSFEGSFDLYCCFSIVRQCINSRSMVGEDPMNQLPGMNNNLKKKLKSQGVNNLRQLILKTKDESPKGIPPKLVATVKKIPFVSLANVSMKFETNKATSQNLGRLKFDLNLEAGVGAKKRHDGGGHTYSFTVVIGTKDRNILLDQKSVIVSVPHRQNAVQRSVTLSFDWALANSNGGSDSGHILLRVLSTDRRGMDIQRQVKLS